MRLAADRAIAIFFLNTGLLLLILWAETNKEVISLPSLVGTGRLEEGSLFGDSLLAKLAVGCKTLDCT